MCIKKRPSAIKSTEIEKMQRKNRKISEVRHIPSRSSEIFWFLRLFLFLLAFGVFAPGSEPSVGLSFEDEEAGVAALKVGTGGESASPLLPACVARVKCIKNFANCPELICINAILVKIAIRT